MESVENFASDTHSDVILPLGKRTISVFTAITALHIYRKIDAVL